MAESADKFVLKVKSPKKPAVEVEVEPDMTVFDVKSVIHLSHYDDIPVENMRAVFKGKILDNDSTLQECNVQSGMTFIIVNMPDTKKEEDSSAPVNTSDASSSNQSPDPNLFSNMLSSLLAGAAGAGMSGANSSSRSGAQQQGFNWETIIPMFLGFANQIRGQVNSENMEQFLNMPQVQAFAQQFRDLPSKAVQLLAQFYQSSSQFQSLVGVIKKGLMEAQSANATNLSIVVTVGILLNWIDKFAHMAPAPAQNERNADSNNSNSASMPGFDIASILGGLMQGANQANPNGGLDIGGLLNNVLQGGLSMAQNMQQNSAARAASNPPNQQQAASPDLDNILDSVLDDDNDDLERLD